MISDFLLTFIFYRASALTPVGATLKRSTSWASWMPRMAMNVLDHMFQSVPSNCLKPIPWGMVNDVVDAEPMRPEIVVSFLVGVTVGAVVAAVEVVAAGAAAGAAGADIVCCDDLSVAEEQSATALHSCAVGIYRSSAYVNCKART